MVLQNAIAIKKVERIKKIYKLNNSISNKCYCGCYSCTMNCRRDNNYYSSDSYNYDSDSHCNGD